MMPNGFLPDSEATLIAWGETFTSVAGQNLTTLKMTATEMAAFGQLVNALKDARAALEVLRSQAKGATMGKDTDRILVESAARQMNLRIQGTAGVSDDLKRQLGLTVRNATPARRRPLVPMNPTVNGYQTGVNALRWERNGNTNGTQFDIEYRAGEVSAFSPLITVTAARFDHQNQTPGVPVTYRIRARRAGFASPFSTEATVYGAAPQTNLTLLKAA